MERFIITGDLHTRATNPKSRLDNYQQALFAKLEWVFAKAKQLRAAGIIIPGDLFDSWNVAITTVGDLAILFKQAPCPIYAIPGNHDLVAGNPQTKHRTPYYLLVRMGLIRDLDMRRIDHSTTVLTGHGFTFETDTPEGLRQFVGRYVDHEESDVALDGPALLLPCHIHVVHSMLLHSPHPHARHTLIEDVVTSANVIITGHDHAGFGVHIREDGVLFINAGALGRLAASKGEMERQVQIAVLEIEGSDYGAYLLPVTCARPGHEVLSRVHIEAEEQKNEQLESFLTLLASEGEQKFLEVTEIVEDIAARENLPKIVVQEALSRISAARESLGGKE